MQAFFRSPQQGLSARRVTIPTPGIAAHALHSQEALRTPHVFTPHQNFPYSPRSSVLQIKLVIRQPRYQPGSLALLVRLGQGEVHCLVPKYKPVVRVFPVLFDTSGEVIGHHFGFVGGTPVDEAQLRHQCNGGDGAHRFAETAVVKVRYIVGEEPEAHGHVWRRAERGWGMG